MVNVPMSDIRPSLAQLTDVDPVDMATGGLVLTTLGTGMTNFQAGGGGGAPAGVAQDVQLNNGAGAFSVSPTLLSVAAVTGNITSNSGITCTAGDIRAQVGAVRGETTIPNAPTGFDAPNYTVNTTGDFKLAISRGYNQASVAAPPFDAQLTLNPTLYSYPTTQALDWCNNTPLRQNKCISRESSGIVVAAGGNAIMTNLGSTVGLADQVIYDPVNMRGAKTGVIWNFVAVPAEFRVASSKGTMKVSVFIDATWSGVADPLNKMVVHITQIRAGVPIRVYLIAENSSQSGECIITGSRTLLGYSVPVAEDIDPLRDYFQASVANNSPTNAITINLCQDEWEFNLCP